MRAYVLALALIASGAHAQAGKAVGGVAADAASTWLGLGAGAAEINPLGYYTVPLRIGAVMYARTMPKEEGLPIIDSITAVSWGAAANNLLVLGGASIAPIAGLMVAAGIWAGGSQEREFWRICAEFRKQDAARTCRYTKSNTTP